MTYLPVLVPLAIIVGLFFLGRRYRERAAVQAAEQQLLIMVGSEVMTTSGLYGLVVAEAEDDTVTLLVAPGVELKWARAALRDVAALPPQYRREAAPPDET